MTLVLFEDDESVKFWCSRYGRTWRDAYLVFERFFHESLSLDSILGGLTPSEVVEWQGKATGKNRYYILRLAQEWVSQQKLRVSSKKAYLTWIRSFFMHNQATLPSDRSFRFRSDIPPVIGAMDCEAFKKILLNCSKMYRAVLLMMAAGLMGIGELAYVSNNLWREVLEGLTKNKAFIKLVLPGRKRSRNVRNFYTLLNGRGDWAEAYRDYMRSSPHPIQGSLFKNAGGRPLTKRNIERYFHWRAVHAGVVKQHTPTCGDQNCGSSSTVRVQRKREGVKKIGYLCKECGWIGWASELKVNYTNVRYGVNPHEIRDLMRSRWQVSGADPLVAEFMLGHDVDLNHYNKFMDYEPQYCIQEYRKALPWLNVLSQDPEKVDRSEIDSKLEERDVEVEVLRREVATLRRKQVAVDELVENLPLIKEILREKKQKEKGSGGRS